LAELPIVSDTPFSDIYKHDNTAISIVNKGMGNKDLGISIFQACMISILEFVGAEWKETQLNDAATIFFDECYWFTFAELKHFAKRAKSMKLGGGKIYGAFTPATFMEWVAEYSEQAFYERSKYFPSISNRINGWTEPQNPVSAEKIKELAESLEQQFMTDKQQQYHETDVKLFEIQKMLIAYDPNLKGTNKLIIKHEQPGKSSEI
jgi:hypothetical protein